MRYEALHRLAAWSLTNHSLVEDAEALVQAALGGSHVAVGEHAQEVLADVLCSRPSLGQCLRTRERAHIHRAIRAREGWYLQEGEADAMRHLLVGRAHEHES